MPNLMTTIPAIPLLILVPIFGAIAIAVFPGTDRVIRWVGLAWSLLIMLVCARLGYSFQWDSPSEVQFFTQQDPLWYTQFGIGLSFGADAISILLVMLTGLLAPLGLLASWQSVTSRVKEFNAWYLLLISATIATFTAQDVIVFYIAFEFTLIPLYFLISVYGGHERIRAAKTYFVYTFAGSMLAFAGLLYVGYFLTTNDAQTPDKVWDFKLTTFQTFGSDMSQTQQIWVLLALMAGFAVKIPLFPFHSIPPAAYPQAPTAVSVLLAAVLAKMGLYGVIRLVIPMTPLALHQYSWLIALLAVIGVLYCALICWSQRSMKKLVAYSSISHLGVCILGLMSLDYLAGTGAIFYLLNHGITIAGLFFCIGMLEDRFKTDDMPRLSGLAKAMPIWAFFFVFFCLANIGLPGLNGFWGEFLTLMGTFKSGLINGYGVMNPETGMREAGTTYSTWAVSLASVAALSLILSAIYTLYMVGKVVFGPTKLPVVGAGSDLVQPTHGVTPAPGARLSTDQVRDLNFRELLILAPLAALALYIGLQPNGMLEAIKPAYQSTAQMTVSRVSQQISAEYRAQNPQPAENDETQAKPKAQPQPRKPKAEPAGAETPKAERAPRARKNESVKPGDSPADAEKPVDSKDVSTPEQPAATSAQPVAPTTAPAASAQD